MHTKDSNQEEAKAAASEEAQAHQAAPGQEPRPQPALHQRQGQHAAPTRPCGWPKSDREKSSAAQTLGAESQAWRFPAVGLDRPGLASSLCTEEEEFSLVYWGKKVTKVKKPAPRLHSVQQKPSWPKR